MNLQINDLVLVTCDDWFFAPDGRTYRAVWGRVKGIVAAKDLIGFDPSRPSTNWYLEIGDVLIAGCRIHYAVKCATCPKAKTVADFTIHDGEIKNLKRPNNVYDAGT